MSRITPHIISIIVFVFLSARCFSQPGVAVKASVDRDKIMIGEPVELKLEARVPANTELKWFPVDSIAHFEFIEKGKIDTVITTDARIYRQTLLITSFDSGRWSVPSFPLSIGNREYLTDSLPVSVAYSNFDSKQDYHDIKDILAVENARLPYVHWVLLGLALVSLGAVIYFLRKKVSRLQTPPVMTRPVSTLSPLQEALQALEAIKMKNSAEQTAAKIFHTGINDILRWFLYRKAGIATMEKTSAELMLQLKQFNLPPADFTLLAQVLRMNDAVKFAKYQPALQENEQAIDSIRQSVQQLDTIIT